MKNWTFLIDKFNVLLHDVHTPNKNKHTGVWFPPNNSSFFYMTEMWINRSISVLKSNSEPAKPHVELLRQLPADRTKTEIWTEPTPLQRWTCIKNGWTYDRGDETSEFKSKRGCNLEMKHACRPKTASRQLHYNYRLNKTIIFRTFSSPSNWLNMSILAVIPYLWKRRFNTSAALFDLFSIQKAQTSRPSFQTPPGLNTVLN